jgi:hypothetical protein
MPSTFLIETRSLPALTRCYLAALPSMSLVPLAPFLLLTFLRVLLIEESIAAAELFFESFSLRSESPVDN